MMGKPSPRATDAQLRRAMQHPETDRAVLLDMAARWPGFADVPQRLGHLPGGRPVQTETITSRS
jgi:hypothetical protein